MQTNLVFLGSSKEDQMLDVSGLFFRAGDKVFWEDSEDIWIVKEIQHQIRNNSSYGNFYVMSIVILEKINPNA